MYGRRPEQTIVEMQKSLQEMTNASALLSAIKVRQPEQPEPRNITVGSAQPSNGRGGVATTPTDSPGPMPSVFVQWPEVEERHDSDSYLPPGRWV